jgi:hypothetical protein
LSDAVTVDFVDVEFCELIHDRAHHQLDLAPGHRPLCARQLKGRQHFLSAERFGRTVALRDEELPFLD